MRLLSGDDADAVRGAGEKADNDAIIGAHTRDFLATDCDEKRKDNIDKISFVGGEQSTTASSPKKDVAEEITTCDLREIYGFCQGKLQLLQ